MEDKHTLEERFIPLLDSLFVPPSHAGQSPVVDWSHWHSKESYERIKSQLVSFIEEEIDLAVKRREEELREKIAGEVEEASKLKPYTEWQKGYTKALTDLFSHLRIAEKSHEYKIVECELCSHKSVTGFQVGKQAIFYSCSAHTAELSKICAPYGDAIGAYKLKRIIKFLTPLTHKE